MKFTIIPMIHPLWPSWPWKNVCHRALGKIGSACCSFWIYNFLYYYFQYMFQQFKIKSVSYSCTDQDMIVMHMNNSSCFVFLHNIVKRNIICIFFSYN
jgi:hypothetical protein